MSRRNAGTSYIEVLVATVILVVALAPAIDALRTGLRGAEISASRVALHYRVTGRMEELLAEPYADLDAEAVALGSPSVVSATYSDGAGTPDRRVVHLSRYDGDDDPSDGDPFTGVDAGLLWIRVEIEGTNLALERLRDENG